MEELLTKIFVSGQAVRSTWVQDFTSGTTAQSTQTNAAIWKRGGKRKRV